MDITDSTKTWPADLKMSAAAIDLATAIWKARACVYGGPADLADEPGQVYDAYILLAKDVINGLRPNEFSLFDYAADLSRAEAARLTRHFTTGLHRADKIIGVISPQPEGD